LKSELATGYLAYYQQHQDKVCVAVGRLTTEGIVVWCEEIMQEGYKGP